MRDVLPHIDYFLPSYKEARALTGTSDPAEMARILMAAGVRHIAIKLGGDGCLFRDNDTEFRVPAYQVPVVDTCGAGDAFVGGFLTGLATAGICVTRASSPMPWPPTAYSTWAPPPAVLIWLVCVGSWPRRRFVHFNIRPERRFVRFSVRPGRHPRQPPPWCPPWCLPWLVC